MIRPMTGQVRIAHENTKNARLVELVELVQEDVEWEVYPSVLEPCDLWLCQGYLDDETSLIADAFLSEPLNEMEILAWTTR